MSILIPVLILAVLGLIFGVGLAVASQKFFVEKNTRLKKIMGLLPGANCGACGKPGCTGFAEALIGGETTTASCRVITEENREEIAGILGRKLAKKIDQTAVLLCNGGTKVKDRFVYFGKEDCLTANLVFGGQKECTAGCLGFGSCVKVCPFGAITMSGENLPVVDVDKCRACNKCVQLCPKKLFILIPKEAKVWVACSLHEPGKETKIVCPVGCLACKLCEKKACKFEAVKVVDYLAVIDYAKCTSCAECLKVCPTKAIQSKN